MNSNLKSLLFALTVMLGTSGLVSSVALADDPSLAKTSDGAGTPGITPSADTCACNLAPGTINSDTKGQQTTRNNDACAAAGTCLKSTPDAASTPAQQ